MWTRRTPFREVKWKQFDHYQALGSHVSFVVWMKNALNNLFGENWIQTMAWCGSFMMHWIPFDRKVVIWCHWNLRNASKDPSLVPSPPTLFPNDILHPWQTIIRNSKGIPMQRFYKRISHSTLLQLSKIDHLPNLNDNIFAFFSSWSVIFSGVINFYSIKCHLFITNGILQVFVALLFRPNRKIDLLFI